MARIILFAILLLGMSTYITVWAHWVFSAGKLKKVPKIISWLFSFFPAAAGLALIPVTGGAPAAIVALGHLTGLLVLCDVILFFVRGEKTDKQKWKAVSFVASFIICAAYITYGAVNAFAVTPTHYILTTEKELARNSLRIVQISDCHLGTTFDGKGFAEHIEAINAHKPDILVITGDFADSRTPRGDMAIACAALADAHAPMGVYYVPGNHEKSMNSEKINELYKLLEHRGVVILEDESVVLEGGFVVCGRKDAYDRTRCNIGDMFNAPDKSTYTIVLDHQPREYDAYAAQGVDLVLSGHTHAGQMFPLGMFIEIIGMGENVYGIQQRESTTFIVSSGMSGLIPLRTEAKSEYVIIDISTTTD